MFHERSYDNSKEKRSKSHPEEFLVEKGVKFFQPLVVAGKMLKPNSKLVDLSSIEDKDLVFEKLLSIIQEKEELMKVRPIRSNEIESIYKAIDGRVEIHVPHGVVFVVSPETKLNGKVNKLLQAKALGQKDNVCIFFDKKDIRKELFPNHTLVGESEWKEYYHVNDISFREAKLRNETSSWLRRLFSQLQQKYPKASIVEAELAYESGDFHNIKISLDSLDLKNVPCINITIPYRGSSELISIDVAWMNTETNTFLNSDIFWMQHNQNYFPQIINFRLEALQKIIEDTQCVSLTVIDKEKLERITDNIKNIYETISPLVLRGEIGRSVGNLIIDEVSRRSDIYDLSLLQILVGQIAKTQTTKNRIGLEKFATRLTRVVSVKKNKKNG